MEATVTPAWDTVDMAGDTVDMVWDTADMAWDTADTVLDTVDSVDMALDTVTGSKTSLVVSTVFIIYQIYELQIINSSFIYFLFS